MSLEMNRREAIAFGMASMASLSLASRAEETAPAPVVQAHDEHLNRIVNSQNIDPKSPWCGGIPDQWGIHYCTSAAGLLRDGAAAYFHPLSRHHKSAELFERMRLAAAFLDRSQHESGFIDLPATNFNSPPDTGFVVHGVATAARLAVMNENTAVLDLVKGFLLRAGKGLSVGGIHTPNHRWCVCAALAQIHELFPDKAYVGRIDQWLAEGIDIDEEGQYTERSTAGYNTVVNSALVVTAIKLNRPELLEPVRKNLDAMAYLLHPNGEVVTEISRRQDLNTRGTMGGYWFALRHLAILDRNGLYAAMLAPLEPEHVELALLMEYPALQKSTPEPAPVPDNYEREYKSSGITRIRRGRTSATIIHKENSRWVTLRRGEAVVNAVRFASAFFGKGQFVPSAFLKDADGWHFTQQLQGRYLQPLTDKSRFPVTPDTWPDVMLKRKISEICRITQKGRIRETSQGFELTISAQGTDHVPLAVEINLREGGELSGVEAVREAGDVYLLRDGFAEYRMGADVIRFGPGKNSHAWVQLRGAEAKLSGPSVYLTGYTPFEHTLQFIMV